jgi:hypothetical protein
MQTIYMPLLDEDVEVYRPVQARHIAGDLYLITGDVPEGETWAFPPGLVVECAQKRFSGGSCGLTAISVSS